MVFKVVSLTISVQAARSSFPLLQQSTLQLAATQWRHLDKVVCAWRTERASSTTTDVANGDP
jgi:hypothetical protein